MKINHAFRLGENKPNQSQFQRQINAVAKIEPAQSVLYAFSLARTLLYAIILGRRNYQQLEGCVMRHNEHGSGRLNDYEYC
jgi:hypothetical protein